MVTNLIEYFENTTVNLNAEKTAVIDNDKECSFKYIRDNSKKLATYLLFYNIAVYNQPTAVFLDKSVNVFA